MTTSLISMLEAMGNVLMPLVAYGLWRIDRRMIKIETRLEPHK